MNIADYFGALTGMAAAVLIVTGYINTHLLSNSPTWVKRGMSWGISIALAFIGQWKGVGMFEGLNVLWTCINGVAVGLIANGIFDIRFIQELLEFIKARKAKP